MMLVLALSVLCLVECALGSAEQRAHFENWVQQHGRVYGSEDEKEARFAMFQESLIRIQNLNDNSKSATFALNEFADMSAEEFSRKMLMPKIEAKALAQSCLAKGVGVDLKYSKEQLKALPDSWDWRTTGGPDGKGVKTFVTWTYA
jgi:hypothetical protein